MYQQGEVGLEAAIGLWLVNTGTAAHQDKSLSSPRNCMPQQWIYSHNELCDNLGKIRHF